MRLFTAEEMRAADRAASEIFGIPSIVLMENAALSVVHALEAEFGELAGKRIAVFCGGGNNGGDGYAIARHLYNRQAQVRVFLLCDEDSVTGDARINLDSLKKMGVEMQHIDSGRQLNILRLALVNCDIVIDALLGTGLKGDVAPLFKSVIEVINNSAAKVFAVDIPSGLDADTGSIHGACIIADTTVTFAYPKLGMVLPAAAEYVGNMIVGDISMPQEVLMEMEVRRELITPEFCRRFLPKREKVSHKGDYGTLLMAAGSADMTGAAILTAKGALHSGVGRVQAILPGKCRTPFASQVAEATLIMPSENDKYCLSPAAAELIADREYTAFVLGMGMGRELQTVDAVHDLLIAADKPCVVDADALYALVGEREFVKNLPQPVIFTPHEGEFARLLGKDIKEIRENAIDMALDFAAEWNVVLVLKRSCTIIATPDGRLFLNPTGNPGMATAGSGDVLSGMIAGLLAMGMPAAAAAAVGVYLHGSAGDAAASVYGEYSLNAGDIADSIHIAIKELLNK